MNLHWGRTLQNKAVQLRHRPNYNITNTGFPYNYTEYKLSEDKSYWSNLFSWRANYTSNTSILHAENQFLKKTRILTDMMGRTVQTHSFTTVIVISSIFLFITMGITAAVLVFCKKKNSVFALQKSEQEDDGEYELDDMATDVEYTETDFESETESLKQKRSPAHLKRMAERRTQRREDIQNNGVRSPLVGTQNESEAEDSPVLVRHVCRCGADARGAYQRMVVTAILEKPSNQSAAGSESGDSDSELRRTRYIEKLRKHYYALAQTAGSDVESEGEGCPISKPPIINVTYVDEPPAYDSLDYKLPKSDFQQQVNVSLEDYDPRGSNFPSFSVVDVHRADSPVHTNTYHITEKKSDIPVMFVELPSPRLKKKPPDGSSIVFVELPPKTTENSDNKIKSPNQKNARSRVLCSNMNEFPKIPVPTLAIIPPTPMADSQPDNTLLTYIDDTSSLYGNEPNSSPV